MKLLDAPMAKARDMKVPECIRRRRCWRASARCSPHGRRVGPVDRFRAGARRMTAASCGLPAGDIAAGVEIKLAFATGGKLANLPGGLPMIVDGHVVARSASAPAPASRTSRWRRPRSPPSPARSGLAF